MTTVRMNTPGREIASFAAYNTISWKAFSVGQSQVSSWATAGVGDVLNPVNNFGNATSSIYRAFDATGTIYVGFKVDGNVGWFSANLGGDGGAVTFNGGQFGNAGESVTVGVQVPEPSAFGLSLLALGAVGLRRRRAANK
ncbi:MAG: PEP-CTERM sorting domain-containing protein [Verrucomicrobiales bacterium]|nr:PEP-CTERM sorting domain-containing protein [Verrucomicrobiales bacterium]